MNKLGVLLLLGIISVNAIRLRDNADDEYVVNEEQNTLLDDIKNLKKQQEDLNSKDNTLLQDFKENLTKGQKNAAQGVIGQSLAESKLISVKDDFE